MIAKNIVQHAGHTALFITASDRLLDLGKQESARTLERRIRDYAGISLLVIDESGFSIAPADDLEELGVAAVEGHYPAIRERAGWTRATRGRAWRSALPH
jgi:hypothetical protein